MANKAFSLIELLVVIAIIGVLAAIAAPAYKTYSARAGVISVYNLLQGFQEQSLITYIRSGSFSSSLSFNGNPLTTNTDVSIGSNNILTLNYKLVPTGNPTGIMIRAEIGSSTNTSFNSFCGTSPCKINLFSMVNSNGTTSNYCGQFGASDVTDLSSIVLPATCNCTNLTNVWNTGVVGGGFGTNSC